MKKGNFSLTLTFTVSIAKIKQFFHAFMPVAILLFLPHSDKILLISFLYMVITGFVYFRRALKGYPEETYKYYETAIVMSLIFILILMGLYR